MPAEPVVVSRAAERIRRRWPDVETPEPETDAEALAREMDRRRHADDWQGFYWADATRTANAFLRNDLWKRPEFGELFAFLIRHIYPDASPSYLRAMFRRYLEMFDPHSKSTRELAGALKGCWSEMNLRIDHLVHRFRVFDIDANPHRRIAKYMDTELAPFRALRIAGLEAPHGNGLMQLAHRRFVSMLKGRIAQGDVAVTEKLLDWLIPEGNSRPMQGKDAAKAVDALLEPWKDHDPDQKLKNVIEARLIDAYGDLRIRNVGVWCMCSEDARQVIGKWLTGATIKVFFDIITQADVSHMWRDRKSLWLDLSSKGRITQAWFALSARGEEIAHRLNEEGEGAKLEFARNQSRRSSDGKKCLLIMEVDGRLAVEGSSDFPTWVFPRKAPSTLSLYEKQYRCENIRDIEGPEKPVRIIHSSSWDNEVKKALLQ